MECEYQFNCVYAPIKEVKLPSGIKIMICEEHYMEFRELWGAPGTPRKLITQDQIDALKLTSKEVKELDTMSAQERHEILVRLVYEMDRRQRDRLTTGF